MADVDWKKISPEEFHQLQEYTSCKYKSKNYFMQIFFG